MGEFSVEKLTPQRFSEVAELEELCFSLPWKESAFSLLLEGKNTAFVAIDEASGRTAAYGGMLVVLDEGQITNVATRPEYRRMGLGERVMQALLEYAESEGLCLISLEVRESNSAAIALYEKLGFVRAGVRKNFYTLPRENAVVMTKSIGDLTLS